MRDLRIFGFPLDRLWPHSDIGTSYLYTTTSTPRSPRTSASTWLPTPPNKPRGWTWRATVIVRRRWWRGRVEIMTPVLVGQQPDGELELVWQSSRAFRRRFGRWRPITPYETPHLIGFRRVP